MVKTREPAVVTEFFRDPEVFTHVGILFEKYLRHILEKNTSQIRIWSAGCSNGSEPYSISILLHHVLKNRLKLYDITIRATDINTKALAVAEEGEYFLSQLGNIISTPYRQYFHQTTDTKYAVTSEVRDFVQFFSLDLLSDNYPFTEPFDMIFCRYVLMFLTAAQQRKLIKGFSELIKPGGLLVIGMTDPMPFTVQNVFLDKTDNLFQPLSNEARIFQKPMSKIQLSKILKLIPERYFCEWCGKAFYSSRAVHIHINHSPCGLGTFHCFICQKDLFSKTGLLAHLKFTHNFDKEDPVSLLFNENLGLPIYREKINATRI